MPQKGLYIRGLTKKPKLPKKALLNLQPEQAETLVVMQYYDESLLLMQLCAKQFERHGVVF